jgi:hypothetical protein
MQPAGDLQISLLRPLDGWRLYSRVGSELVYSHRLDLRGCICLYLHQVCLSIGLDFARFCACRSVHAYNVQKGPRLRVWRVSEKMVVCERVGSEGCVLHGYVWSAMRFH